MGGIVIHVVRRINLDLYQGGVFLGPSEIGKSTFFRDENKGGITNEKERTLEIYIGGNNNFL